MISVWDVIFDPILSLSIQTAAVTEQQTPDHQYRRRERFSGEFQRTLTLPGDVDPNSMKTELNNSVLTITVTKA